MTKHAEVATRVDPITVEVVRNSLMSACDAMRATVEFTAYSPLISEVVDFCCALVDAEGRLVAENSSIPVFLGIMPATVREILRVYGPERLGPGDVIFCNDPYSGGFTHCPDVSVVMPVFWEGKLAFFAGFKGHCADLGGIAPSGVYTDTTETYQEGVMFPPVKLYAGGELNTDLVRIIERNTRLPRMLLGDLRAMVAAVRVGAERCTALLRKFGEKVVFASIQEVFRASERMAREAVKRIPDGSYEGCFWCDGDGDDTAPLSQGLKVNMRITVRGEEMTVDLTGSSPQSPGPMNLPLHTTISQVRYGFKMVTTPMLPNNEGCFAPLSVVVPRGSVFDPVMPAATSLLWPLGIGLTDLMLKLLGQALPEIGRAGHFGDVCPICGYGTDPRNGQFYLFNLPTVGGWGGKPSGDGETMFCMDDGDTYDLPVEVFEVKYPWRVVEYSLVRDTGGPGKYRGGLGVRKDIAPVGHLPRVNLTFDRRKLSRAWGVEGGRDGSGNRVLVYRKDGRVEEWGKATGLAVDDGEVVSFQTGGGGGWGDPLERELERVRDDVANGYVSPECALEEYGVVLRPDLSVDVEATFRERSARRGR